MQTAWQWHNDVYDVYICLTMKRNFYACMHACMRAHMSNTFSTSF
jgi:hypothetical protein